MMHGHSVDDGTAGEGIGRGPVAAGVGAKGEHRLIQAVPAVTSSTIRRRDTSVFGIVAHGADIDGLGLLDGMEAAALLDQAAVEGGVVHHHDPVSQGRQHLVGNVSQRWCASDMFVCNAMDGNDRRWNWPARPQQRLEEHRSVICDHGDLNDFITSAAAGCFGIDIDGSGISDNGASPGDGLTTGCQSHVVPVQGLWLVSRRAFTDRKRWRGPPTAAAIAQEATVGVHSHPFLGCTISRAHHRITLGGSNDDGRTIARMQSWPGDHTV